MQWSGDASQHCVCQVFMNGLVKLGELIAALDPALDGEEYVFITEPVALYGERQELHPIATFAEREGLTLVVPKRIADEAGLQYEGSFRRITLRVHSSLNAVGLTAAVTSVLAGCGLSANVIAAFYHDHIFVPTSRAQEALQVLEGLANEESEKQSTS